jgi:hypothetical protein
MYIQFGIREIAGMHRGICRLGQILQIGVLLQGDTLPKSGIIVAHLGDFSSGTGGDMRHGAPSKHNLLLEPIPLHVRATGGKDIYTRDIGQSLVEIELLLHYQRGAAIELSQAANASVVGCKFHI